MYLKFSKQKEEGATKASFATLLLSLFNLKERIKIFLFPARVLSQIRIKRYFFQRDLIEIIFSSQPFPSFNGSLNR